MPDRLRIALIGAGEVARKYHLPAIRGVPEVEFCMVVDADAARARKFAERYNVPRWGGDADEIDGAADVAIVALPNALHAPVTCRLLGKGIHVLCEKPMARNVAECREMIEAADRSGAILCIGHNRRFKGHVRFARKLLAKGQIGSVTSVDVEEGSSADWNRSPAYFDPAISGGGSLMDVGIHAIDLIRWLAGEFETLEYSGDGTETSVESEAEMRFALRNGAMGALRVSRSRQLAQRLVLTGTEGRMEISLWGAGLRIESSKGKAFERLPHLDIAVTRRAGDSSFVEQLANFVSAIRGRGEVLVNGREGMAAVEVVTRAYASPRRPGSSRSGS